LTNIGFKKGVLIIPITYYYKSVYKDTHYSVGSQAVLIDLAAFP